MRAGFSKSRLCNTGELENKAGESRKPTVFPTSPTGLSNLTVECVGDVCKLRRRPAVTDGSGVPVLHNKRSKALTK